MELRKRPNALAADRRPLKINEDAAKSCNELQMDVADDLREIIPCLHVGLLAIRPWGGERFSEYMCGR